MLWLNSRNKRNNYEALRFYSTFRSTTITKSSGMFSFPSSCENRTVPRGFAFRVNLPVFYSWVINPVIHDLLCIIPQCFSLGLLNKPDDGERDRMFKELRWRISCHPTLISIFTINFFYSCSYHVTFRISTGLLIAYLYEGSFCTPQKELIQDRVLYSSFYVVDQTVEYKKTD